MKFGAMSAKSLKTVKGLPETFLKIDIMVLCLLLFSAFSSKDDLKVL